jgi:bifunctional aspartokinase / homoserine dehydrogenase 1
MKVMKFGGTSVADATRIRQVAGLVAEAARGDRIGLVVSAISGTTNHLLAAASTAAGTASGVPTGSVGSARGPAPGAAIVDVAGVRRAVDEYSARHLAICRSLAEDGGARRFHAESPLEALSAELERLLEGVRLLGECPPAVRDRIAALGEQASVLLVRQALETRGLSVFGVDPGEFIVTDEQFSDARVDYPATYDRFRALRERSEDVLLMPGFIGRSASGRLTTLGRNGSDHSATLMGRGLLAAVVEIWTDVDGVMSADPRLVANAFVLPEVSYREAMEMAYFGASVIHPLTLVPVMDAGIPVRVCNTLHPEAPGTWIRARGERPAETGRRTEIVRAVTCTGGVSLLNVQGPGMTGVPGIAARVFQAMAARGINVIFISQASSEHSICFAVSESSAARAVDALRTDLEPELHARKIDGIERHDALSILSVIGEGMRGTKGTAATLFTGLAGVGVNIVAIAQGSSELNISVIIDSRDARRALTEVHDYFFDRTQVVRLFVMGAGGVGGELVEQVRAQRPRLLAHKVDVRVCGLARRSGVWLDMNGLDLEGDWRARLDAAARLVGPADLLERIRAADIGTAVLVDATASDEVAASYAPFLEAGVHVVTPNKRANTAGLDYYRELRRAANAGRARFLYETTVGAGLPLIDTLQNLLKCGDRLIRFEGILSGSCSFIAGHLGDGRKFSAVVTEARDRGFTEPDPRDDLSGLDVARKLVILAREAGLPVELKDVQLEPFLPAGFDAGGSVEQFLARLETADAPLAARTAAAAKAGGALRYVGAIEEGRCRVGLAEVPLTSPVAAVRDGENIASFLTERYRPIPLVIRGYGAGPVVTSTGIFSDILRLTWFHPEGMIP